MQSRSKAHSAIGPGRSALRRALRTVGIAGVGSFAPEDVLDNAALERMVDTTDEWIRTRTGIRERRRAKPGQGTSELAIPAARRALEQAGLDGADLELIVVATVTPDQITPSTACYVQNALGATRAAGFDLNAACSGFVTALATADGMVASGACGNALVVGADVLTAITDYTDRESCVLFGDGAGAVVLTPIASGASGGNGAVGRGALLDHELGQDGSRAELIQVAAGGSRIPASAESVAARQHFLRMQGREVFRFAVGKITELVERILTRNGLSLDDLALLVPHQANQRILDAAARALGLPMERVVSNVERYGNTSNASVPLALDEAVRAGRMRAGDHVVLVAFGGGLTWGASLVRW